MAGEDRTVIVMEWDGAVDLANLARVVDAFRDIEDVEPAAFIDVLLTDDVAVAELNESFRGVPGPTDVLSFDMRPDDAEKPVVWTLGQVVISCDRAREQALDAGIDVRDELAELLVHGLLHLLGYTHDDEETTATMVERANLILSTAN